MPCASSYVTFPLSGLTVHMDVWLRTIDLEFRGIKFVADGEELVVSPRDLLTAEDCAFLKRWKQHILAMLTQSERVRPQ